MKIGVYGGEAFPVYSISDMDLFTQLDVDIETLKRWKKVFNDFSDVQVEITNEMSKQGHGDRVWSHGIWEGFDIEIDEEEK